MRWLRRYGPATIRSWDFLIALTAGALATGLGLMEAVRDGGVTILLAEAAIGVAVTSTVFAGMAVFATFFDGAYRLVLEHAGGFRSALMPYFMVSAVAGTAALVGLLGALALPAVGDVPDAALLGLATLLATWAITGTVSLVDTTLFHAHQRALLLNGADEAGAIRARRLRERSEQ